MIGLIGKKLGMTQIFAENGELIPVTIISATPNLVIHRKTQESNGYDAHILGTRETKNPNRPYSGIFKKVGVKPTFLLREIRNSPSDWKIGKEVTLSIFSPDSKVRVTGSSKGRGFQGVVKRHGFHGGPGAHGSKFHRRPGSIGTSKTPSKVIKGHLMPGRMGNQKITIKNLKIVKTDIDRNLLFLKGSVPGAPNSWVLIKQ